VACLLADGRFRSSYTLTIAARILRFCRRENPCRSEGAGLWANGQNAIIDIIQVQRLKKRKLQLRDRITFIEDQLTPDIIA
jgi:hypothetical protein